MERETENAEVRSAGWLVIPSRAGFGNSAGPLSAREVNLWALVLASRNIEYRIEPSGTGWQLLATEGDLQRAREELSLFEEENRNWPPPPPPLPPLAQNTLSTLSVLLLLATFHNFTQIDTPLSGERFINWLEQGKASAAMIMAGQWWRLVTALTLHSDWLHLSGNLAIGGVFILLVCRDLGSGLAWSLLLASGILGNLLNAYLQPADHSSIGASTVVFGAVGILAALSLIRNLKSLQRRMLLPVATALALLALLGTEGKFTDLGAHLFGLLFGFLLGLAAEYLVGRWGRPGRRVSALLALASAALVFSAWWRALTS
jgi:membrane associated rhomboid family serine protease